MQKITPDFSISYAMISSDDTLTNRIERECKDRQLYMWDCRILC